MRLGPSLPLPPPPPASRAAGFNPIMEGGEGCAREGSPWTLVLKTASSGARIKWLLGLLESGGAGEREGPAGELTFCSRPRFPGSSSPREHRSDLFQHLTFNHDKTVGKLIVLRDIKHQTPLILSEQDAGCILIRRAPGRRGVSLLPTEAPLPTPRDPTFLCLPWVWVLRAERPPLPSSTWCSLLFPGWPRTERGQVGPT